MFQFCWFCENDWIQYWSRFLIRVLKNIDNASDFVIQNGLSYFNSQQYYLNPRCSQNTAFTAYFASSHFTAYPNQFQLNKTNFTREILGFNNFDKSTTPIKAFSTVNWYVDNVLYLYIKNTQSTSAYQNNISFKIKVDPTQLYSTTIPYIINWNEKQTFTQFINFDENVPIKNLEICLYDRFNQNVTSFIQNGRDMTFTLLFEKEK